MISPVLFLSQPTSSPPVSHKSAVMRPRSAARMRRIRADVRGETVFFSTERPVNLCAPPEIPIARRLLAHRNRHKETQQPRRRATVSREQRFRRRSIPPPRIPERRSRGEGTRPDFSLSSAPSHFLPIWSAHTNVFLFLRTPFLFVAPCYFL